MISFVWLISCRPSLKAAALNDNKSATQSQICVFQVHKIDENINTEMNPYNYVSQ